MKAQLYQKSHTELPDNQYDVDIENKCVARWSDGDPQTTGGWECGGELAWKRDYIVCKSCGTTYEVYE